MKNFNEIQYILSKGEIKFMTEHTPFVVKNVPEHNENKVFFRGYNKVTKTAYIISGSSCWSFDPTMIEVDGTDRTSKYQTGGKKQAAFTSKGVEFIEYDFDMFMSELEVRAIKDKNAKALKERIEQRRAQKAAQEIQEETQEIQEEIQEEIKTLDDTQEEIEYVVPTYNFEEETALEKVVSDVKNLFGYLTKKAS